MQICVLAIGLAVFGLSALPIAAQVKAGDNLSMNLDGQVSAGYTADYGNYVNSDHGFTFGGNANLTGNYYSPGFLSFNINPFYNQSRANSTFQSILDSSGVNAGASIFSGSHFPGTVSYSKLYTNSGTFDLPGLPNYTTSGNSDAFGIGWSELLPDMPSVSVNYQQGASNYSVYGESLPSQSNFHSLNVNSNYLWDGFTLTGGYNKSKSHAEYPAFVQPAAPEDSNSNSQSFYAGLGHPLPLSGSFSGSYTHSTFDSDYTVSPNSAPVQLQGSVNAATGNAFFHPVGNLSTGASVVYTDNLFGSLYLPIINQGNGSTVVPSNGSHSLNFNEYANYLVTPHVTVSGYAQQLSQNYFGGSISTQSYTGTVSYSNYIWGGNANILGGVTANSSNTAAAGTSIGAIASGGYSRDIGQWGVAGSVNYAQNTQTALAGYTTSSIGYSGNVNRRFKTWRLTAIANGSHTLLNHTNYSEYNQTYSGLLSNRWFGLTGSYTNLSGNAIIVGSGLTPSPIPAAALPSNIIFYGGKGWSAGIGGNPIHRLSVTATYSDTHSNTGTLLNPSNNLNETIVATMQYQMRQIYINGGYTRLLQGFSASNQPATLLGSWYIGIQRWFNFF